MDHEGPTSTWRQRLSFDEEELLRVEEHACLLEKAKAEAELALTAARTHFEALKSQVTDIHERRESLRTSTMRLRAKLAAHSFRRLPPEILQAVFLELAQEDDPSWIPLCMGTHNHSRSKTPFILAAVSRGWRELALENHRLWAYISVPLTSVARATHLVNTLIVRSGEAPIDILLPWGQSTTVQWTGQSSEARILDLIGAHAARWRRFQLHLPKCALNVQTLGVFCCPTPLLEDFTVSCRDVTAEDMARLAFPLFLPFIPRLRYLFSRGCNIFPSTGHASLEQLRSLRLRAAIPCRTLWALLRGLPNLEILSLRVYTPFPDPDYRLDARLEFRRLHKLSLFGDACTTLADNMRRLAFPTVDTIVVNGSHVQTLSELWPKVNQTLVSLNLEHEGVVGPVQLDTLRPLNCLRSLVFRDCVITSEFLESLAEERAGAWALPALNGIWFLSDAKLQPENSVSLMRLLRARSRAHGRTTPGAPSKIGTVTIDTPAISPWIAKQVAFVLKEST
ncbi:hypothetical protein AURDEDRAFT_188966 [Auricularia subglabra TFB-10046 SS5]|uniref:F-box domain-containing protein n=1 Tax=Auricularia subglabra (strain TFB-10046 / SS5) TaxID=717982 RepID=J0D6U9_AURST|nr:hypothetical protein AURDEDRAFT_188966 [Auricularia subglabra TFB-10046 SS5]